MRFFVENPDPTMASRLALLSSRRSRTSDEKLVRLAAVMGIETVVYQVEGTASATQMASVLETAGERVLAARADTISMLRRGSENGPARRLLTGIESAFVYGAEEPGGGSTASELTDGRLKGTAEILDSTLVCGISGASRSTCAQFSGLSFSIEHESGLQAFTGNWFDATEQLISLQNRPYLVTLRQSGCRCFLLAASKIADVNAPVPHANLGTEIAPALLPAMIFMRESFGDRCWSNPRRHATVTIDDPLLRPRYGYLTYDRLVAAMRTHRFASTVAFIPWNYRRSDPVTAELFNRNRDVLSICTHGCDHSAGEFGIRDRRILRAKARLALERAQRHKQITGVGCEPIMIFPQGVFSNSALPALRVEGYLAAVNTSVQPTDPDGSGLTLRDLLDLAVMRAGFPLFPRRYPRSIAEFALDLFLGKPLLITTHHQNFRNDAREISEWADRINSIDPHLIWAPLAPTLRSTALHRRIGPHNGEVRFFTDELNLANPYTEPAVLSLSKQIDSAVPPTAVMVNGRAIDFEVNGSSLKTQLKLAPRARVDLKIINVAHGSLSSGALHHHEPGIAARRFLSEFRDNYLARSDALTALSRKAARLVPR
jgi:hypothetical protein